MRETGRNINSILNYYIESLFLKAATIKIVCAIEELVTAPISQTDPTNRRTSTAMWRLLERARAYVEDGVSAEKEDEGRRRGGKQEEFKARWSKEGLSALQESFELVCSGDVWKG